MLSIATLKEKAQCGVFRYEDYLVFPGLKTPSNAYKDIKSVVVFAFPYDATSVAGVSFKTARFAGGRDYHQVVAETITSLLSSVGFPVTPKIVVDITSLHEKIGAYLAGLGTIGKNTLLLSSEYGSCCVLGEALFTEEFDAYDTPDFRDVCGDCTRCIDACPTQALSSEGLNRKRCLSYLTQAKSKEPYEYYEAIKNVVYGCDICQEVCPVNQTKSKPGLTELRFDKDSTFTLDDYLENEDAMIEASKNKAFHWIGYDKMLRNLVVASSNRKKLSKEVLAMLKEKYQDNEWFMSHIQYIEQRNEENEHGV